LNGDKPNIWFFAQVEVAVSFLPLLTGKSKEAGKRQILAELWLMFILFWILA